MTLPKYVVIRDFLVFPHHLFKIILYFSYFLSSGLTKDPKSFPVSSLPTRLFLFAQIRIITELTILLRGRRIEPNGSDRLNDDFGNFLKEPTPFPMERCEGSCSGA
jgi:hypothetical protein